MSDQDPDNRLQQHVERTARSLRELIEIGRMMAATGNIRGPVPPKMEELLKLMDEATHEIKRWYRT